MPPPVSPHPDSGLGATTFTHFHFVQRCKMHIMHRRDMACNEGYTVIFCEMSYPNLMV